MTDADEIAAFVDGVGAADLVTFDGVKPVASLIPVIWDRGDQPGEAPEDEPGAWRARSAEPGGGDVGGGDLGGGDLGGGDVGGGDVGGGDLGGGDLGGAEPGRAAEGENWHGRLIGHLALANPQWRSLASGARALAIVHGPQAYISPSWYPSKARHGRVVPTWNYVTVHFTGVLTIHRDEAWLRDVVTRLTGRHERGRADPWSAADAPVDYIDGMLRAIVGVEMAVESIEAKSKLSQNRDAEDRAGAIIGLQAEPDPGSAAIADLMSQLPADR